jgi:hypothetical protein
VRRSCSILLDYEKARHNFGNVGVDGGVTVTFILRNRVLGYGMDSSCYCGI